MRGKQKLFWRGMVLLAVMLPMFGCKNLFEKDDDYNPYKDETAEQIYAEANKALKNKEYIKLKGGYE